MQTADLVTHSDLIAIVGGIAFAFGSIGCMMLASHLAALRDLHSVRAWLRLAGGFTIASVCLLAATVYCVVDRCEHYCRHVIQMQEADQKHISDQAAEFSRVKLTVL